MVERMGSAIAAHLMRPDENIHADGRISHHCVRGQRAYVPVWVTACPGSLSRADVASVRATLRASSSFSGLFNGKGGDVLHTFSVTYDLVPMKADFMHAAVNFFRALADCKSILLVPFANRRTVSFVDVSPSTEILLKLCS